MTRNVLLAALAAALVLLPGAVASAAGPMFWDSPAKVPFRDAELQGAALDGHGSLVPGLAATAVLSDSSLVFWSAAAGRDGAVFVGSGHEGRVWRIDRKGQATLFADLPAGKVFSLLADGDGIVAGCGPGGEVFQVDGRGGVTLRGTVTGGFVWGFARTADGELYVASGNPAAVHRLPRTGDLELVTTLPADNALDIAARDDGTLLVATQGPGRVFVIRPRARTWELLLALDQDEGRQLVRGPDGWYALGFQAQAPSGGQGNPAALPMPLNPFDIMVTADADVQPVRVGLYRLEGAVPQRVWSSERGLTSVAHSADLGWVGAGQRDQDGPAALFALSLPNGQHPLARWEGGDVLDLLVVDQGRGKSALMVAQAHPGVVTRLAVAGKDEAVAVSPPLDGRLPVRWGRLAWQGAADGQEPRFAVRAGNSPSPDATWSTWLDLDRGRDVDLGRLPAARALQWRVTLPEGSRVDAVTVSAVAPNLAPQITLFEVQPAGELVRGGMMASGENVTQRFESGLQIEYSVQRQQDRRVDRDRSAALRPLRTLSWHARDPNEDRLSYRLFQRREGDSVWRLQHGPTHDQVYTWDTSTLVDGLYEVRLVASDEPANPGAEALTDERVIGRLAVDNTPPVLADWSLAPHADGFVVALKARDAFGPLAGAEVVMPDGSVGRLDPVDGICDSAVEEFRAVIVYPGQARTAVARPWTVRVRVWDLQGNVARLEGVLP